MRKITPDELKAILENHRHWLREDCDGWEVMKANLSSADLSYANLSSANLRSADLSYANLSSANLSSADLSYANLSSANLSSADLRYADLRYADLRYADLSYANLRYADLSYANLRSANLSSADLRYADLRYADLRYANLSYADLSSADLSYAYNLDEAKGLYLPTICPSDGEFTGWKKCRDGIIAKLLIPETAKRSSATGRKCRASEAVVCALYDENGKEVDEAVSQNDADFIYRPGETVRPKEPFDENRWNECASGIHFFVTREEAERY